MNFIPEESKREAELRKKVEAAFGSDPDAPSSLKSKEQKRAESAKEKSERARKDYEQKQKTLEYKRERLEWQKERSKLKDKLRREAEQKRKSKEEQGSAPNIKIEPITDKDRDPTAYKKAIGGVASFAKGAIGVGTRAVINAAKKRKEKKDQEKRDAAERASQNQQARTKQAMSQSSRLLPGTRTGETEGQRARRDPSFKKREIERRGGTTTEEFSFWREEFLYELGDLRKKKKAKDNEDYIVDVMPKNKRNLITVGPDLKEDYILEKLNLSKIRIGARKLAQKAELPILATSFALGTLQSPESFVRSGHVEGPGMQRMSMMMRNRKEADRNLDSGRVSHPARNKKNKGGVNEAADKMKLLKAIVKKLVDEKKRKNYLLNYGYIGEAKYDKSNLQCNKPKSDPVGSGETGKSHVVKACEGGTEKLIRFGQRGVKGSPKKKGESESYANRRKRFKTRHAKNIAKGKMSAAYWANLVKW